jgi:hypothetical protein
MYNNTMTNIVQEHPSVVSKQYILNANDRCDKCQVQAVVRVKGLSGELTFCNHHYEKIMNNSESHNKMMSFLVEVLDEREKLIKNKPTGGI